MSNKINKLGEARSANLSNDISPAPAQAPLPAPPSFRASTDGFTRPGKQRAVDINPQLPKPDFNSFNELGDLLTLQDEARRRGRQYSFEPTLETILSIPDSPFGHAAPELPDVPPLKELLVIAKEALADPDDRKAMIEQIQAHYTDTRNRLLELLPQWKDKLAGADIAQADEIRHVVTLIKSRMAQLEIELSNLSIYKQS